MLFKKLAELQQEMTKDDFGLLLNTVEDDVEFHKTLSNKYTEDTLVSIVNQTVGVIRRL
ncbi:MAG: hypothetical protein J6D47_02850 [Peptostreptococcaceae bacterium]|mgnify:CR=1 FL=1|nr:hypothetical protein [Peptostreptococcaceae bacterium]